MREIKFRAWNVAEKSWMWKDINLYTESNDTDKFVALIVSGIALGGIVIQQFTGLKDKNGKEIYEGDIVTISIPMTLNYKHCKGEIMFSRGSFIFNNFKHSKKIAIDMTAHAHDRFDLGRYGENSIKIIGNIYENPELLEVSK